MKGGLYLMYICEESGMTVYEALDELLNSKINFVTEYEGAYYFKLKPYCNLDNSIWKVNKTTGKVEYMMFTQYLCTGIAEKAKPITVEEILNERKRKCS